MPFRHFAISCFKHAPQRTIACKVVFATESTDATYSKCLWVKLPYFKKKTLYCFTLEWNLDPVCYLNQTIQSSITLHYTDPQKTLGQITLNSCKNNHYFPTPRMQKENLKFGVTKNLATEHFLFIVSIKFYRWARLPWSAVRFGPWLDQKPALVQWGWLCRAAVLQRALHYWQWLLYGWRYWRLLLPGDLVHLYFGPATRSISNMTHLMVFLCCEVMNARVPHQCLCLTPVSEAWNIWEDCNSLWMKY